MNSTCTGSVTIISCNFGAFIPSSQVSIYSSSEGAPYQFGPKVLYNIFNPIVQDHFALLANQLQLAAMNSTLTGNTLFTVEVTVPLRFTEAIGLPIPVPNVAVAISQATGLPVQNILDAWVS